MTNDRLDYIEPIGHPGYTKLIAECSDHGETNDGLDLHPARYFPIRLT